MKRRRRVRNKEGGLPAVLCLVILLMVIMFASLGVDVSHNTQVRDQLQTATDAGALAGVRELAQDPLTSQNTTNASNYASGITGANDSDGVNILDSEPNTTVQVTVDTSNASYRTVTVEAHRTLTNVFAYMVGHGASMVGSKSVAACYRGLKSVDPGGAFPLAVSLDYVPTGGPATGQIINQVLTPSQTFTIVFNANNDSNAAWVKTWGAQATSNTSTLNIGDSYNVQNGVNASIINGLSVGQQINPILISGGPPYNQTRQALGVVSTTITAIGTTQGKHWITLKVKQPIIIPGTPGAPSLSVSSADQNFLNTWSPWHIGLVQ